MSFFHKKNVTKFMGHHYAIWASDSNMLLAQRLWLAIISGTVCTYNIFVIYMSSQTTILYLKTCSFDCSLFLEFNARSNRQYDLIKGLVVVVQNKFVYYYKYQYLCVEKYDPLSCNIHINTIS
jgi:hypothetical protein